MSEPRPSIGGKVVRWIEACIVHGEGDLQGEPFLLRPDQKLFIWRWFELSGEVDSATGVELFQYDRAYYEAPKGLGKTMLFAALAIESFLGPSRALRPGSPNVPIGANSEDQADDTIWGRIKQVLEHDNCPLKPLVTVFDDEIVYANGDPGKLHRVPNNARTVDGGLPTEYVADEVHDWVGAAVEAHQKIENSTTKRTNGRQLSCSTPGAFEEEPSVGWRLHKLGVDIEAGHLDDPHFLFVSHRADLTGVDLDDPAQLEAAIREATPGITDRRVRRLLRRSHEIDRASFCRFHLGVWPKQTRGSWLEDRPSAWTDCVGDVDPGGDADVWMAVDASLKRDSTAVVTGWRDPGSDLVMVSARVWDPAERGGVVPLDEVAQHVRDMSLDVGSRLRWVAYDPRLFEQLAQQLADENVPMLEFPQSPERMIPACSNAYRRIVTRGVVHDGDPVFARHVTGAQKRHTEAGWSLTKKRAEDGGRHIDACIALVMLLQVIDTVPVPDPEAEPVFVWT